MRPTVDSTGKILLLLRDGPKTMGDLVRESRVTRRTLVDQIHRLLWDGVIMCRPVKVKSPFGCRTINQYRMNGGTNGNHSITKSRSKNKG
jgi:hypothetical protein